MIIKTRSLIDPRVAIALTLWAMVGGVAIVLVGRALAGAFDVPVGPAIPLLATFVTLCGSLTAWNLFHHDRNGSDAARRLFDGLLAVVPAGLTGFATAVNADPTTLAVVTCLLICGLTFVIAREGVTPRLQTAVRFDGEMTNAPIEQRRATASVGQESLPDHQSHGLPGRSSADEPLLSSPDRPSRGTAPDPQQHVTRRRQPDGGEEIEAVLLATFVPGQRQTAVHLPIQPVLQSFPQVECEPLDDAIVSARVTGTHRYGLRIEIKRSGNIDTFAELPVGIFVTAPAAAESAA